MTERVVFFETDEPDILAVVEAVADALDTLPRAGSFEEPEVPLPTGYGGPGGACWVWNAVGLGGFLDLFELVEQFAGRCERWAVSVNGALEEVVFWRITPRTRSSSCGSTTEPIADT
nr:hypothetical protein [Haladaptatus salinisoli]